VIAPTLTRETVEQCLAIVAEELTFGNRSQALRQAYRELNAVKAHLDRPEPLAFTYRPHPTRPVNVWTFASVESEVRAGSRIDLGLAILYVAASAPHQHVDLTPFDPAPLEAEDDEVLTASTAWRVFSTILSRAREFIADRHPELAAVLRRVRVISDSTAIFSPEPSDPEVKTS
jgi:phytoene dehydrogenase-like protein